MLVRAKPIALGAIAGLAIWLFDFDFFINAGGPDTPISDFICGLFELAYCCCGTSNMPVPPLVLSAVGASSGLLFSLAQNIRRRPKQSG